MAIADDAASGILDKSLSVTATYEYIRKRFVELDNGEEG